MNGAQIHLALNHFPLILTFCGLVIVIVALIRKHQFLFRTAAVFFVVSALATIPTYFSGEPAEEVVEEFPGVTEQFIEAHEEAAEWTLIVLGVLGAVALVALIATRRATDFSRSYSLMLMILSLITFSVIARTSHLGGQIRHQELRPADAAPTAPETQEND